MELVKTWERWCQVFNDLDFFRLEVLEICRAHGVRVQKLENTFPGTHAVFFVNDDLVLKLFCPVQYSSYALELVLHNGPLRGSVYFPQVLFHGTSPSGYEYIAFERFYGRPIREQGLDALTNPVLESLADLVAWMHSLPLKPELLAAGVLRSLDTGMTIGDSSALSLVHYDLTRDHIYLDDTGRLQGIIDFGDAVLGHPGDDFPVLFIDSFACDDRLIEAFTCLYNSRSQQYQIAESDVINSLAHHPFSWEIRVIARDYNTSFASRLNLRVL